MEIVRRSVQYLMVTIYSRDGEVWIRMMSYTHTHTHWDRKLKLKKESPIISIPALVYPS
jgi:hypothetical protein